MTDEEIWADDVLGRQEEAANLIAYIESIAGRKIWREDGHAQTIAIDAGYGEGKSFFLRRFARQLARNHPVAFVDAWSDDLVDDPLTAIVATLDEAFNRLPNSAEAQKKKWAKARAQVGQIAKIALKGAAARAVGFVVTAAAVEAASGVLKDASAAVREAGQDSAKKAAADLVDGTSGAIKSVQPGKLMIRRIAEFREARTAVSNLKASLRDLVLSLDKNAIHPPIVVVIDELDRCRPTYAIKLLEEVKHLFDAPGVVFVFGMHADQLAHSVCAAYGPSFDGKAYLKRFIGRQYRLAAPSRRQLVKQLLEKSGIDVRRLTFPKVVQNGGWEELQPDVVIASYVDAYSVPARDVFQILDMLQTSAALTGGSKLCMPYLIPLIIGRIQGVKTGTLPPTPNAGAGGSFGYHDYEGRQKVVDFATLAGEIEAATRQLDPDISVAARRSFASHLVWEARGDGKTRLAHPRNYKTLLEEVGRFSNPELHG